MSKLDRIISNLKDFDINKVIEKSVRDNRGFFIDSNTEEQLYEKGINTLEVKISDYAPYHIQTLAIKTEKGQPTDRVTLRDEGDFHHSFNVDYNVSNGDITLYATDEKTEKLTKKYGKDIFGLTDENLQEYITYYLKDDITNSLREVFNG